MNVSNVEYTAGLGGFLVLFGLALVLWFLGRDLSRRLRRLRHREELRLRETSQAQPRSRQDEQAAQAPSEESEDGPGEAGTVEDPNRSQE